MLQKGIQIFWFQSRYFFFSLKDTIQRMRLHSKVTDGVKYKSEYCDVTHASQEAR